MNVTNIFCSSICSIFSLVVLSHFFATFVQLQENKLQLGKISWLLNGGGADEYVR